jgi:hypothetical protein
MISKKTLSLPIQDENGHKIKISLILRKINQMLKSENVPPLRLCVKLLQPH